MTTTTGRADMNQHPDVSEIADLTEGLLPSDRAGEMHEHLASCVLCEETRTSLEEVRDLLTTAPPHENMPDDIAARIDAALAAESPAPPAVVTPSDVSRETSRPAPHRSTPKTRPGGTGGPGRTAPRRNRRRVSIVSAALAVVAAGLGTFLMQSGSGTGPVADGDDPVYLAEDGSRYRTGELKSHVAALLDEPPAAPTTSGGSEPSVETEVTPKSAAPNTPMKAPDVPECITRGIGRDTPALTSEKGKYEDTEAFLVVLPHTSDRAKVLVYIVDASCVGKTSASAGEVLLRKPYARN